MYLISLHHANLLEYFISLRDLRHRINLVQNSPTVIANGNTAVSGAEKSLTHQSSNRAHKLQNVTEDLISDKLARNMEMEQHN